MSTATQAIALSDIALLPDRKVTKVKNKKADLLFLADVVPVPASVGQLYAQAAGNVDVC